MVYLFENSRIDTVKEVYRVVVPGTPNIMGKLVKAMEVPGISRID